VRSVYRMEEWYLKGVSSYRTITRCGDDGMGERLLEKEVVVRVEIEVEAVSLGSIRHGRREGCSENGAVGEASLREDPPPVGCLVPHPSISHGGGGFASLCFALLRRRHFCDCAFGCIDTHTSACLLDLFNFKLSKAVWASDSAMPLFHCWVHVGVAHVRLLGFRLFEMGATLASNPHYIF
jgi:hypothetical protein